MSRGGLAIIVLAAIAAAPWSGRVLAQERFDVGAQFVSAASDQFDESEFGVGGRLAWHPIALVGVEAEVTLFPGDFPDQRAFSGRRVEGLFGVTVGPRLGSVRPFARLRPGFVSMSGAPGPFPCILIFPPPLACTLAAGQTLPAFDIGGGVEVMATRRAFVRVDVGDRMVRYTGPAFDRRQRRRDGTFYGHDLRVAVGAGVRF